MHASAVESLHPVIVSPGITFKVVGQDFTQTLNEVLFVFALFKQE